MRALSILYVEDEDPVAGILELITKRANADLKNTFLEYHRAATVSDAIDSVNDLAPDICIVDINLPDGSGLEVIEYIKNNSHARVSVLSGEKMGVRGTEAWKAGATAFLEKDNIPEFSKNPDFLREHLKEYLIALANEQSKILGQRFRVELSGKTYKIGRIYYKVGTAEARTENGRQIKLGKYDPHILNFYCKYPRENMSYEDLDRELGYVSPKTVKKSMDVIMSRFRSRLTPFIEIRSEQGAGHKLMSPIELIPTPFE